MRALLVAVGILSAVTSAAASVPVSGRFDLQAPSQPLLRGQWLQDRRHVPQSFAFDDANGFIYVLQVEGSNSAGTHGEHSARGDLVLTKLTRDGGTIAGHMVLRGFGHGVAMGVEPDGAEVYIWTEVESEPIANGVGRGSKIARFRFVSGVTLDAGAASIAKFSPARGAHACTPSIDMAHRRIAIRYVSMEGEWRAALHDLDAFKAGVAEAIREIALPYSFGTVQGWSTYGSYLYVYAGEPTGERNPAPGNATLWCLDWNTGRLQESHLTRALADLEYREPEGLAVQIADRKPRLCFGFGGSVSASDSRRQLSIAFKSEFVEPDDLAVGFMKPPDAARPATFWWWFNNYVSREGITRDLQEFRNKGLGGVVLINTSTGFGAGPIPSGPKFLSPEWRVLFRHALDEASRVGLEVGVNLSTGWCMGGPWITPENSGRWFLQSSLTVEGPSRFSGVLPLPGHRSGYDNARHLFVKNYVDLPLEQLDYRDTAIVAFPEPHERHARLDGERLALLAAKSNRFDASSHIRAHEVMAPTLAPWTSASTDTPVSASRVVDLTAKVGADGSLTWDVPAGRWVILRTGHRMTGARTAYALPEGEGLEVDWLNEAGVEAQFEALGRTLMAEAGPHVGKTLQYFHEDSFEDGFPNWTATFLEKFRRYRGYDPTPYLPVLSGRIVGSAEISDRFLYDYRRTVADCMADAHYGRFAELCHTNGLEVQNESAGPSWSGTMCMDALKNLGRSDRPMGEFWQDNYRFVQDGQNQVTKMVATAAHIYGKRTASAEAFTTFSHWSDDPAALKPTADRAFCEGINRIVMHTSTSTRPEDGKPGYEYGAGTHFNPNVTWWEQSGAFVEYLARCQFLLQSGLFVADVLYYNGDWAPNLVGPRHVPSDLGPGFDYDVCNSEVLLTRLAVKDRRLVLPDGMSYRVLVLPDCKHMTVEVARKLRELVRAGATVVGPPPRHAPGLTGFPGSDREVSDIAAELWGDCDGKERTEHGFGLGRVIWGRPVREILAADRVTPDFQYDRGSGSLDFIHRSVGGSEIYFVVNRNGRPDRVVCTFRVSGLQPELWDPVRGTIRELRGFSSNEEGTLVPLEFAPWQSWFVVFRKPAKSGAVPAKNLPFQGSTFDLSGAWDVSFDPAWGGPSHVAFASLTDWTENRDEGIRYYSGKATYRKSFDFASAPKPGERVVLDLGVVRNLADVTLNGVSLGVVWTAPWSVEVTGVIRPGANLLEIDVVNLWPNRLIGDKYLPASEKLTRTNIPLKDDARLLPSGLLGPVKILRAE